MFDPVSKFWLARTIAEGTLAGLALVLVALQLDTSEASLGVTVIGGIVGLLIKMSRVEQRHALRLAEIAVDVKRIDKRCSRLESRVFQLPSLADPTPEAFDPREV
jgi:hypothetical protein